MNRMNKVGKGNGMWIGFVTVILAILLIGYFGFMRQSVATPTPSENIPTGSCDSTTTPNLTINAYDLENKGTAVTEATNSYREKGTTTWKTFTAGTGFDASALKTYEVVMGVTTSNRIDNAYGKYFEYIVPCSETPSIEREVANDEVEGSLTATFYNADGDASAETFSAGETQTVSVKLKAGTDEYYGNPFIDANVNRLVIGLNSTEWDAPEQVYLSDGTELKRTEVPTIQTLSSGIIYYAYELPAISDKEMRVYLDLNADDSTAPVTDMTGYIYAGSYYINSETGNVEFGVEDDEDNAVGASDPDTVTLDFTA